MKKYYVYKLKKSLPLFALLFALGAIAYILPLALEDYSHWNAYHGTSGGPVYVATMLQNILAILTVSCLAAPFYMLSYKMTPKSADMYYSLPITRTKLFAVHFTIGFLYVFAAYSANYLIGFIVAAAKIKGLNLIWYLWAYLASVIPAFSVYALTSFTVTRANSPTDAVLFVILSHFALTLILAAIQRFIDFEDLAAPDDFIFSAPLFSGVANIGENIYKYSPLITNPPAYGQAGRIASYIVIPLLGAAATAAMFLTEKNCKAENCGQFSQSIFGYKLLVPVYIICPAVWLASIGNILDVWPIFAILAFCGFILMALWRRTIKIGKRYALLYALYLAVSLALTLIAMFLQTSLY